jgi:hypothetical protein
VRAATQVALDELAKQASTVPHYWFVQLITDQTPDLTVGVRVVNAPQVIEFPTGSGNAWDPAAFKAPTFHDDSEGTIPRLDLTITDPAGEILTWCDRGAGFSGRDCTIWLCSAANVADTANAVHALTLKVAEVNANDTSVTFSLGLLSLLSIPFPRRKYQRDRCDLPFTGDGCFFRLPSIGQVGYGDPTIIVCDKTLDGPAGCRHHGDNEVARGLPRNHPLQFGSCKSIPMGPRR